MLFKRKPLALITRMWSEQLYEGSGMIQEKKILMGTIFLLLGVATNADENSLNKEYCKQAFENGITADMIECTQVELQREDNRLNVEYKKVMSKLNSTQKLELRTEQRAWIKTRDRTCKLEEDTGSAGWLNHISCLKELTKKRADELAKMK